MFSQEIPFLEPLLKILPSKRKLYIRRNCKSSRRNYLNHRTRRSFTAKSSVGTSLVVLKVEKLMLKELLQNPLFLPQIIKNQEIGRNYHLRKCAYKAANGASTALSEDETTKLMAEMMPMITLV